MNLDRFHAKYIQTPTGCWQWTASLNSRGYPLIGIDGRPQLAHRMSHLTFVGPIPDGYHVDHLCSNPRCVNPEHLEAVTPAENARRRAVAQTHCKHGHSLASARVKPNGSRQCRTCEQVRERARNRSRADIHKAAA